MTPPRPPRRVVVLGIQDCPDCHGTQYATTTTTEHLRGVAHTTTTRHPCPTCRGTGVTRRTH